eukprot:Em0001g2344a
MPYQLFKQRYKVRYPVGFKAVTSSDSYLCSISNEQSSDVYNKDLSLCSDGCSNARVFNSSNLSSNYLPLGPPQLVIISNQTNTYRLDITSTVPMPSSLDQVPLISNLIVRVQQRNATSVSAYYWLMSTEDSLDLSPFSCQNVSLSFAVVSHQYSVTYSSPLHFQVPPLINRNRILQLRISNRYTMQDRDNKKKARNYSLKSYNQRCSRPVGGHRFMMDNDSKHSSKYAGNWMKENHVNMWKTPPEPPDLNAIENLWHKLKEYISE